MPKKSADNSGSSEGKSGKRHLTVLVTPQCFTMLEIMRDAKGSSNSHTVEEAIRNLYQDPSTQAVIRLMREMEAP